MGALKGKKIEAGDFFGNWEVITYSSPKSLCRCLCGRTETLVRNAAMKNGGTKGCQLCGLEACHSAHEGLKTRRVLKDIPDEVYRRLFTAVNNAIYRCTSDNYPQTKDYKGRGITVHSEWLEDKWKFIEYLYSLEGSSDPELVLDRRDNDGNYGPGNLRFVNRSLSSFNRRRFNPHSPH